MEPICDPLPIIGLGIGFGSPLGRAWVTQASRLGHAWVTLGSNGTSALFATKVEKRGVGEANRRDRAFKKRTTGHQVVS